MIVLFSGLDSSGKSTQIEYLQDFLGNRNKTAVKIWSRGGYTSFMQRAKDVIRIVKSDALPEPGDGESHEKVFSDTIMGRFWLILSILDLIRLYSIQIRLLDQIGLMVICDRYISDTLIDFRMKFPHIDFEDWFLWRLLVKTAASPDYSFYIDISIEESMKRSAEKDEPFSEDIKTRKKRYREYCILKEQNHWQYIVNGSDPKEIVREKIMRIINL